MRLTPPANRWAGVREGESLNEATLRVLQASLPPGPERRRERCLQSNRSNVSDEDLWDFWHGATVEGGSGDDQLYDEAVESEEESSDGSFSQVTNAPVASPEDESADM